MRRIFVGVLLSGLLLAGLAGCAAPVAPSAAYGRSGWRTSDGARLSLAEVAALEQSCRPRQVATPVDTSRPPPNPLRDNAAYRPGGESLANAPATGLGARDRPVEPGITHAAAAGATVAECLREKGLVPAP